MQRPHDPITTGAQKRTPSFPVPVIVSCSLTTILNRQSPPKIHIVKLGVETSIDTDLCTTTELQASVQQIRKTKNMARLTYARREAYRTSNNKRGEISQNLGTATSREPHRKSYWREKNDCYFLLKRLYEAWPKRQNPKTRQLVVKMPREMRDIRRHRVAGGHKKSKTNASILLATEPFYAGARNPTSPTQASPFLTTTLTTQHQTRGTTARKTSSKTAFSPKKSNNYRSPLPRTKLAKVLEPRA